MSTMMIDKQCNMGYSAWLALAEQRNTSPAHLTRSLFGGKNVSRRVRSLRAHHCHPAYRRAWLRLYCRTAKAAAHRRRNPRRHPARTICTEAIGAHGLRQAFLVFAQCQYRDGLPLPAWIDPADVLLWS